MTETTTARKFTLPISIRLALLSATIAVLEVAHQQAVLRSFRGARLLEPIAADGEKSCVVPQPIFVEYTHPLARHDFNTERAWAATRHLPQNDLSPLPNRCFDLKSDDGRQWFGQPKPEAKKSIKRLKWEWDRIFLYPHQNELKAKSSHLTAQIGYYRELCRFVLEIEDGNYLLDRLRTKLQEVMSAKVWMEFPKTPPRRVGIGGEEQFTGKLQYRAINPRFVGPFTHPNPPWIRDRDKTFSPSLVESWESWMDQPIEAKNSYTPPARHLVDDRPFLIKQGLILLEPETRSSVPKKDEAHFQEDGQFSHSPYLQQWYADENTGARYPARAGRRGSIDPDGNEIESILSSRELEHEPGKFAKEDLVEGGIEQGVDLAKALVSEGDLGSITTVQQENETIRDIVRDHLLDARSKSPHLDSTQRLTTPIRQTTASRYPWAAGQFNEIVEATKELVFSDCYAGKDNPDKKLATRYWWCLKVSFGAATTQLAAKEQEVSTRTVQRDIKYWLNRMRKRGLSIMTEQIAFDWKTLTEKQFKQIAKDGGVWAILPSSKKSEYATTGEREQKTYETYAIIPRMSNAAIDGMCELDESNHMQLLQRLKERLTAEIVKEKEEQTRLKRSKNALKREIQRALEDLEARFKSVIVIDFGSRGDYILQLIDDYIQEHEDVIAELDHGNREEAA